MLTCKCVPSRTWKHSPRAFLCPMCDAISCHECRDEDGASRMPPMYWCSVECREADESRRALGGAGGCIICHERQRPGSRLRLRTTYCSEECQDAHWDRAEAKLC